MKKLLTIILILSTSALFAQTYYISPTGNDATGNGSVATPWKTLYKAATTVTAGTINVAAGTYTESQYFNVSPNVNIVGADSATTRIKATMTGQWSSLFGMESNSLTNGNNSISNITFDGGYVSETNYKTWQCFKSRFRHNLTLTKCQFIGFYDRAIIIEGNGDDRSTIPIDPKIYATGIKVLNCSFINTARNAIANPFTYISGQLNIGGTKDMEVSGCVFLQTQRVAGRNGEPIKLWGSGYNLGLKILNNIIKRANFTSTQYNGSNNDWNFAIELFNSSGLEIAGNTIQGSIDINYNRVIAPYTYSVWIHDNDSDHSPANNKEEAGIIFEFETDKAIVENNRFLNQAMGITFNIRTPNENGGYNNPKPVGGYSATTDVTIRNNLFYVYGSNTYGNCCGWVGIQFLTEGDSKDGYVRNLLIDRNTFVNRTGNPATSGIDLSHFTAAAASTNGITISNNIFQGFSGQYLEGGSAKMLNTVTSGNLLWQNGNNNNPAWTGSLTNTGNVIANPNFDANYISPSGKGYLGTGTPPPPSCTYTYSAWSDCINGIQSRTVTSFTPANCVGTPILTQSCTITPPTCTYVYSAWGECINGTQTRTVVSVSPANCAGTPVLSQSCTVVVPPSDTTYCTIILHGTNLTRRAVTYFVKRADGFFYDNSGIKREVYLFKSLAAKWYFLNKNTGNFEILF